MRFLRSEAIRFWEFLGHSACFDKVFRSFDSKQLPASIALVDSTEIEFDSQIAQTAFEFQTPESPAHSIAYLQCDDKKFQVPLISRVALKRFVSDQSLLSR